jgi:hypothetical protein
LLDIVLRSNERDGRISLASYGLLLLFNAAVFAVLFANVDRPWAIYGIFAALVVQAGIIVAALLIMSEETRYWDGLMLHEQKVLPSITCVRTAGMLTFASVALVFLAALLCQHLDQYGSPLFKSRTSLGCEGVACHYFEYVLACLSQMPGIDKAIELVSEKLGLHYELSFTQGAQATAFRAGLAIATGVWILGALRLVTQQWSDVDALCQALEKSKDDDTTRYLQMRAARAPGFMKRRMVRGAVSHADAIARRRYITTCYHAGVLTFPQTLIHHLADQTDANKDWGLRQARRLLEEKHTSFDLKFRMRLIKEICNQLKNGDHKPGIVSDLWRMAILLIGELKGADLNTANNKMLITATERISAPTNYPASQMRLLDLCCDAKIKAFPQAFLFNLERHSPEVRLYGLQLVHRQVRDGTPFDAIKIQNSLNYAFKDHRSGPIRDELMVLRGLIQGGEGQTSAPS